MGTERQGGVDNPIAMSDSQLDSADSITRVAGIEVGQFTDTRRPTGCSVVIARAGAVAGVDVRGAAPGTRETDLLHPSNLVDRAHAILLAGTNTTIGVIATDAILTKAQAHRLAQVAHDGLARSINPVHTLSDGDALFTLGTGQSGKTAGMMVLGTLAAEVTARAVVRAVRAARSASSGGLHWPAACDL